MQVFGLPVWSLSQSQILQGKAQLGGKPQPPQNPQGILRKTCLSISHTTDHTFFQILHPMKQIYQSVLFIVRHRIDRKIPAQQIL